MSADCKKSLLAENGYRLNVPQLRPFEGENELRPGSDFQADSLAVPDLKLSAAAVVDPNGVAVITPAISEPAG